MITAAMPLSDRRGSSARVPAGLSRSSELAAGAATSERFHDAAAARRATEHRVLQLANELCGLDVDVLHEPLQWLSPSGRMPMRIPQLADEERLEPHLLTRAAPRSIQSLWSD